MSDQFFISISTIPDIDALRSIHKFTDLSDEGVLNAALHLHHQQYGHKVLPLYQQQIISMVVVKQAESGKVSLHHLQNDTGCDAELLKQFDALLDKKSRLISWGMASFDLPLINYRQMKYSFVGEKLLSAQTVDLSHQLSNGKHTVQADLAGLSCSLGLPSIPVLSQSERIERYLKKQLGPTYDANQIQALNIYLISLRYQLIKADISMDNYIKHNQALWEVLKNADSAALKHYESAWLAA